MLCLFFIFSQFLLQITADQQRYQQIIIINSMWKNHTTPYIKPPTYLNYSSSSLHAHLNKSNQEQQSDPKPMNQSQAISKLKESTNFPFDNNSVSFRNQQIKSIEDNEKLRVQLFRAHSILSEIQGESQKIKKQILILMEKTNKRQSSNKENHKDPMEWKSILKEVLRNTDSYVSDVLFICQEYEKLSKEKQEESKKIEQINHKGAKVYKQILKACQQKLKSAESLLNEMTVKLEEKNKRINYLEKQRKEVEERVERIKLEMQSFQKQNILLCSDQEVYKNQMLKKSDEIARLREVNLESNQKYENLLSEYETMKVKAEWFEKVYEENKVRANQLQTDKMRIYEQFSITNRQLTFSVKELESELKKQRNSKLKIEEELKKDLESMRQQTLWEINKAQQETIRFSELYQNSQQELIKFSNLYKNAQQDANELSELYKNTQLNYEKCLKELKDQKNICNSIKGDLQDLVLLRNEEKKQTKKLDNRLVELETIISEQQSRIEELIGGRQQLLKEIQRLEQIVKQTQEDMSIMVEQLNKRDEKIEEMMNEGLSKDGTFEQQREIVEKIVIMKGQKESVKGRVSKFNLSNFQFKNSIGKYPFKGISYW